MRHGDLRESREGRAPPGPGQVVLTVRRVEVVRTYLALDDREQLIESSATIPLAVRLERRDPCPVDLYRRLYRDVGEQWYWHDRLEWSDEELAAHLALPTVRVWELLVSGESAGYFELQRHQDGSVEIVYFGLTQKHIGRGLGGMMLTRATREAFSMGATRVWLHTCTLDHPNALASYKRRGFRESRTQRLEVELEGSHVVGERLLDP